MEKQLIINFLDGQLRQLNKFLNDNKEELKYFNSFCFVDPDTKKSVLAQQQFELGFNTSGYTMKYPDFNYDLFDVYLEGKNNEKNLNKALQAVIKDEMRLESIKNNLKDAKDGKGKTLSVPNNGEVFRKLLERLYRDSVDASRKGNFILESVLTKYTMILENIILTKHAVIVESIEVYEAAIKIVEELKLVISDNKYINFTDEKASIMFETLSLNDKEKEYYDVILKHNYNLGLKKQLSNTKRTKTRLVKKVKNEGLENASADLENKVLEIKDEFLLQVLDILLEKAFEEAYDNGDDIYHDLARLSLDCTDFLRKKGIYTDSSFVESRLATINQRR